MLVGLLVAALAFLLASFPARNSDLWMHLAQGRLLAQGEFSFGTDPQSPSGLRVSNTLLYDLLSYGVYSALGGPGLVLCKALLVVGLGLLLLRLSWVGPEWWVAVACTVLALLAMGIRLLPQPATVSCLLLALTLWFLRPRAQVQADRSPSVLPPWQLLVLFVIWGNVDSGFVLGLGTVALVWLGRILDEPPTAGGRLLALRRRALSLVLLGAACLLNPFFLLDPLALLLQPFEAFLPAPGQVTSPFQRVYLANLGLSPAGLAYYPVLGLGLLSFVLNYPRWHWQRLLPWLGLALLSVFQVRAVPFFAVVAGPVLAWNLQEFFARRLEPQRRHRHLWRGGLAAGQLLTVTAGLTLLVCAWPGWLQAPPFEPRRWAVETAPSLEQGAQATRRWHQEGRLGPATRGLHLSPETAYAFAWFCPEEKGLRDEGLTSAVLGIPGAPDDWAERMRAAGINHVIVYDPDRGRLVAALGGLLADPGQWPLLYLEGDLAVFGWRDPAAAGAADPFQGWELDLNRLAFRPAKDQQAPRQRPGQEPEVRPWWDAFWKPAPPRPIDRDAATLHLMHAEALRRSAPYRHLTAWEASQLAGLVGAAGGWAGPGSLLDAHGRLVLFRPRLPEAGAGPDALPALDRLALEFQQRYTFERDDTPPALLYLAVRAARRALAANPNDAQAHLVLGESYLLLLRATRERAWGGRLPEFLQLRRVQAITALSQAVVLKPDLAQAHLSLGGVYEEMGCLDLALNHLRVYQKLSREAGPPRGVSAELVRDQEARFQDRLDRLAKTVETRENAHTVETAGMRVLDRALLAAQGGLAGKARDLLLESDVAAFGSQGMALELELLLRTGRTTEVREWTSPEHVAALGASSYHWLRAQALAAAGDYALAEEELAELVRALAPDEHGRPREVMTLLIGQELLDERPVGGALPYQILRALGRIEFQRGVAGLVRGLQREADVTVLRGLLALEQGDVDEAEVAFRVARALWQDEAATASGGGLEFNGRAIAQDCLHWLEQEGGKEH